MALEEMASESAVQRRIATDPEVRAHLQGYGAPDSRVKIFSASWDDYAMPPEFAAMFEAFARNRERLVQIIEEVRVSIQVRRGLPLLEAARPQATRIRRHYASLVDTIR